MQIVEVPIEKIIRDPNNPRVKFDTPADHALAESIVKDKIHVPMIGFIAGEKIMIGDGHRRFAGALKAGKTTCPMIVFPSKPSEAELLLTQLTINAHRENLNPIEEYEAFNRAMKLKNWSATDLAIGLSVSNAEVTRVMSIGKLTPDEWKLVLDGKLSKSSAYALTRLAPEERTEMAIKAAQGEITRDELNKRARRPKKSDGPKKRRFVFLMEGAKITVQAIEGMDLSKLAEITDKMNKECKRAQSQNLDISTAERVMHDRNRAKPAA